MELVVLGTASQTPTKTRNHNGYLLRIGAEAVLFDPGEGTQRQLSFAGISSSAITHICITHFHGDHVYGLPGMLSRMALETPGRQVHIHYPIEGEDTLNHLVGSVLHLNLSVERHGHTGSGVAFESSDFTISHAPLRHRVPTLGWRVEEPARYRMDTDKLDEYGLHGRVVGELLSVGHVTVDDKVIMLDQVAQLKQGRSMAVVMDTAWCINAIELARDVDVMLCESTFLASEAELAAQVLHLTAEQAAQLASEANAKLLVLTHFSKRYSQPEQFYNEAVRYHNNVIIARDLQRISISRYN